MTKITIHWQKMQFHKIPKCRVSFMTWSWAFSIYDNNWIPVDWASIEVPVWTILSYVSWAQWTVYEFSIWNKSYAVYERNWYSWTKKYLEWIIIDWTAFTKWTHTITWDTKINALWVRNGISITFDLSPQPTPTPPPAPILYPSWVLVDKVTLNYDWYAAIISFDEWESILVPEQQWYEATWASVSAPTALYADTIITVYLQSLVTCDLVGYQDVWRYDPTTPKSDIMNAVDSFIHSIWWEWLSTIQFQSPNDGYFSYILYDWRNFCWLTYWTIRYYYIDRNGQRREESAPGFIAFFFDGSVGTMYATPYVDNPSQYLSFPLWNDTGLISPQWVLNPTFNYWDKNALDGWINNWNCWDTCWLIQTIYNLATNK